MGQVIVRRRVCTPSIDRWGEHVIEKGDIGPPSVIEVPVRIASLISVNARATPVRGPVRFHARQHELRLLLSFLDEDRGTPLRLHADPFHASASHIRRFVSEGVGLGLLTGTTEAVYQWRARQTAIANFDALPASLIPKYNKSGVRPDLLFQLPTGDIAGEARGRSSAPPKTVRADQLKKLQKLLAWSDAHGHHPFVMSWASVTDAGTTVDFFECQMANGPKRNLESSAMERHAYRSPAGTDPAPPSDPVPYSVHDIPHDLAHSWVADQMPPGELAATISERVHAIDQELFDSAPQLTDGTVFGRPTRGAWAPLDLLGGSGRFFFLGVLSGELSAQEAQDIAIRQAQSLGIRDYDAPLQVDVSRRLVTAITQGRRAEPPSMRELREMVE